MPVRRGAASGLVKRYVEKVTGLSRAQVTRLIDQHAERNFCRPGVAVGDVSLLARYTAADIALLAEVDEAHETLSGIRKPTRKILYRG